MLVKHAVVLHSHAGIERFFEIESLGTNCNPRCGSCVCGTCHPGGKNMSLQEEEELRLIEDNITFTEEVGRWNVKYPWIKDPWILSDNRFVAMATLRSTENRLRRNTEKAKLYDMQIQDMVQREAARILESQELKSYKDPVFYLSHHAVLNPNSKSTPCRIVFNSSAKFKGCSLNDCLAKGVYVKWHPGNSYKIQGKGKCICMRHKQPVPYDRQISEGSNDTSLFMEEFR